MIPSIPHIHHLLAWAWMAASETGSLEFIDDFIAAKSSRMKSEVPFDFFFSMPQEQVKTAAVKTWQIITREEIWRLVTSMGSRLKAVTDCKRFATVNTWLD